MKQVHFAAILFTLSSLFCTTSAFSQVQKAINDVVKEKMKAGPADIERLWKEHQAASKKQTTSDTPKVSSQSVDGDPEPESEMHAVINPTDSNNLIVSAMRYTPGTLTVPIFYSKDFGKTWKESSFNPYPKNASYLMVGGGDPNFSFDTKCRVYFTWISLFIKHYPLDTIFWNDYWAYSDDGGATWNRENNDTLAGASGVGNFTELFDKEWLATDKSNSLYKNTLYAAYYHPTLFPVQTVEIGLRRKRADSLQFSPKAVSVSGPGFVSVQYTSIEVDDSGYVHVVFFGSYDAAHYYLFHSISKDGGDDFSPPAAISEVHMPPFSPDEAGITIPGIEVNRMYPCDHLAIDHSTGANKGNLYLVWAADGISKNNNNGMDIYFSISKDNGTTWSHPKVVNDDYSDTGKGVHQFHPSITVNPNGLIGLGWYDRRGYAPYLSKTNYYMANSNDGGQTFTKNFPITNMEMDFSDIGFDNGGFGIGEYTQIVSSNGYIIPFWADGRDNNGNIDIYTALVHDTVLLTKPQPINPGINFTRLYPTPASANVTAEFTLPKPENLSMYITDERGRIMSQEYNGSYTSGTQSINIGLTNLYSGKYFFVIRGTEGKVVRPFNVITKN